MLLDDLKRVKRLLFIILRYDVFFILILVCALYSIGTSSYNTSIPYKDLLISVFIGSCIALMFILIGKFTKLFKKENNYKSMIFIISMILFLFILGHQEEFVIQIGLQVGYYNTFVVVFLIILLVGFNWSNQ